MESTPETVFTPQLGDLYLTMAVSAALFFGLLFVIWRLGKTDNKDPRQRILLPMLAYFFALLTMMGFLGPFWATFKFPTISIGPEKLVIGQETYPRPRNHEVRLESYTSSGLNNGGRVLLIQTRDRITWAFPEDRYDINEMYRQLK